MEVSAMPDHDAERPPELVCHDVGGWISGPCLDAGENPSAPDGSCGRCGQPAPEGSDWCADCEEQDGAEALAALRETGHGAADLSTGAAPARDDQPGTWQDVAE